MAEIVEVIDLQTPIASLLPPAQCHQGDKRTKPIKVGRRSKFKTGEDLIIFQEVAAAEAYVAPHGETLARFEKSAERANANPNFKHVVTGKNLQGYFKKLLDDFATRDGKDRVLSGVGGEIGALQYLFGDMLKANMDIETNKNGDSREKHEQVTKKLKVGQEHILKFIRGRKCCSQSDEKTPTKKRRPDIGDGMASIGMALRESERVRLVLEREKMDREYKQREADRIERAAKRSERVEELASYCYTMERVMEQNASQMQAVLFTTVLAKSPSSK